MTFNSIEPPVRIRASMVGEVEAPMAFVTDNHGTPDIFLQTAKELVVEKYNRDIRDLRNEEFLTLDDCYVVWFSKTLQHWKALVSTDRSDGRYYELTHDGSKECTYVDVYTRESNEAIFDADR